MDFFDILTFIGGLAFFLYGMQVLGDGLSKASGGRMEKILGRLTANRFKAVLLGVAVTAVIQSSSAATVMVVGFVNSNMMQLSQAVGVIMGANIGTTITSWVLSLSGIESGSFFVKLLKPSAFSSILALVGAMILLFSAKEKRKNTALIFIGFAVLIFGMETMTDAVKPLAGMPGFTNLLLVFSNPVLGLLAGLFLTAIVQSSSASIGILQALCTTGAVTYETAIPIIMGQNIGTCITALLSSIGTSKNAKRAAAVHLYFNLIGTIVFMFLFYILHGVLEFSFMKYPAKTYGIAALHSIFNLFAALLLVPFAQKLEKLACLTIREDGVESVFTRHVDEDAKLLDERFLSNPALAMEQCRRVTLHMAVAARESYADAVGLLYRFNHDKAEEIAQKEMDIDRYEDMIGTYLLEVSKKPLSERDSQTLTLFLECIGDFARISSHAVHMKNAYRKLQEGKKEFSDKAKVELDIFSRAVMNIVNTTLEMLEKENASLVIEIESLLQVVGELSSQIRKRHIKRLRKGKCTTTLGFLLSDIVTSCERVAAHCSHIAASIAEVRGEPLEAHGYDDTRRGLETEELDRLYHTFKEKYVLP